MAPAPNEGERYDERLPVLRRLAQEMPNNADVRELIGLVHYRLGRWSDAIKDLEAYRQFSNSQDQHPVLADATAPGAAGTTSTGSGTSCAKRRPTQIW